MNVDDHFGNRRDILLMDNNVFASKCFDQIIDEIVKCGFGKPDELYYRMKINVDLCQELGIKIYSFPMKYLYYSESYVTQIIIPLWVDSKMETNNAAWMGRFF